MTDSITSTLAELVGPRHVLLDADLRAPYERDWTGRWQAECLAVVSPGDAGEVAAVVRACAAQGIGIVPQGGNTGLVGSATPRATGPQVVLSLTRLNELGEVDPATAQVSAGSGVTLAALQQHAGAAGWAAGLDLAARDSATVGGLVACNAGGIRAIRYGTARARVGGLEAVLGDGTVVRRMSGLLKDNAGFDIPSLLIGSEGTLGVITAVRWRLVPRFDARTVALIPVDSIGAAVQIATALRPRLESLELCELITAAGMEIVLDHLKRKAPTPPAPAFVLLECAARTDPLEELADALTELAVEDRAVVAADADGRARLLRLREAHTEAIAAAGLAHKLDVGVPISRLAEFIDRVGDVSQRAAPGCRVIVFGHLGDGNVHVNVLGPEPDDVEVETAVLELAADCDGTISAEHGVGVQKSRYLSLVRSEGELSAMRAIKRALDPAGILNPGVILEA
jgi:FAD/FMN-containing dehydrogenase